MGFKTQRAHATTPRMRMDLRTAVTWRDEVEAALERLLGAVRPAPKTTPTAPEVDASGRAAGSTGSASGSLAGQAMNSASSLSSAAFGRAPTIDFTTSPPW